MLIDSTLVLSDAQAVTASAASEQTIDQSATGDAHNRLYAVAVVEESFAGLENLKISLQTSADSSFSAAKELTTGSFALAELKEGAVLLKTPLPCGALRFIRGYYTVSGTATAGKISLFITDEAGL